MKRLTIAATVALALSGPVSAQESPLTDFGRLIGGEWTMPDGTVHVFEWGLGRLSFKSLSYFTLDGKRELVSEGIWFWHPGEQVIKGYHTAVQMPVSFFDYTTHWEGDTMVNRLVSYGEMGGEYRETWAFTGPDSYEWTLYQDQGGAEARVMGGTWTRKATGR